METIKLKAELLLILDSKQDWVNKVPRRLPPKQTATEERIWNDAQGHVLSLGEDFKAAETLKTYPVKVYRLVRVVEALKPRT